MQDIHLAMAPSTHLWHLFKDQDQELACLLSAFDKVKAKANGIYGPHCVCNSTNFYKHMIS